ncbi:hypothetical protein [Chryseobacterium nepalense]|uniref:Magnesium and cobalt transport protein CorA n=1 Tax=Chryseobacterium nepalense TaxID=1854498 RepID=A0ABY4KAQ6_9FLAO|nr:hypothetical protein [Chryseobacterium nepalense]UPQ77340.1 hypothetical protein M0D58_07245 [Chryseobacterium nepalense]
MFEKSDKRRLYWLIDQYLSGQINGWTFCNEYYYSYSLEIKSDDLTDIEQSAFSELDKISSRYTDVQEDLFKYPDTYYNEEQLKQKLIETKEKLREQSPI